MKRQERSSYLMRKALTSFWVQDLFLILIWVLGGSTIHNSKTFLAELRYHKDLNSSVPTIDYSGASLREMKIFKS